MSAQPASAVRSWRVGHRTVTLTVPPLSSGVMHATACWDPEQPSRLTGAEYRQYETGRAKALSEICVELGLPLALVERL